MTPQGVAIHIFWLTLTKCHCRWWLFPAAVDCGDLEDPDNGVVEFDATTLGEEAVYSCDVGHTLRGGESTRVCTADAVWSGVAPNCTSEWQLATADCSDCIYRQHAEPQLSLNPLNKLQFQIHKFAIAQSKLKMFAFKSCITVNLWVKGYQQNLFS